MSTQDLIDHFKLEAEVFADCTLHVTYKMNRARGVREKSETKWERMESIGEGAFGRVWREVHSLPGGNQDIRAVKIIEKHRMQTYNVDFRKELLALAKFSKTEYQQAEVFVSFLGWFENDRCIFLAMEYFENGDLAQHIHNISTEDEVGQIATDLLEGLRIMHSEGFAHRDLKPQNIFVVQKPPESERWWVKIGDFGISKRVRQEDTAFRTHTGTQYFQAPEIQGFIDDDDGNLTYSNAVDMWSLGCVIYNMSTQEVPFLRLLDVRKFCQGILPFPEKSLISKMGNTGIEFLKGLLIPQPNQRMSAERALESPWIIGCLMEVADPNPIASREILGAVSRVPSRTLRASQRKILQSSDLSQLSILEQPASTVLSHSMSAQDMSPYDSQTSTSLAPLNWRESNSSFEYGPEVIAMLASPTAPDAQFANSIYADSKPSPTWSAQIQDSTPNGQPAESIYSYSKPSPTWSAQIQDSTLTSKAVIPLSTLKPGVQLYWKDLKTLKHNAPVRRVVFSPDGKLIASASRDMTVRVWDSITGKAHHTLKGHDGEVYNVAFSPDSKLIASASRDKTVKIWNSATGEVCHTLEGHVDVVYNVEFSLDGRLIASASHDKTVRLWDSVSGEPYHALEGHDNAVYNVAFSPDSKLIASASWDKTVKLWNSITGELCYTINGHDSEVYNVAFSPDGKLIASASRDKMVWLWDSATGVAYNTLVGHDNEVYNVSFSPDGKLIASASYDKTIRLWDLATGEVQHTIKGLNDEVYNVAFSLDYKLIASASYEKTIKLWVLTAGLAPKKRKSFLDTLRRFF